MQSVRRVYKTFQIENSPANNGIQYIPHKHTVKYLSAANKIIDNLWISYMIQY